MSDSLSSSVEAKQRLLRPVGRTTVIAVITGVVIFLLVPGVFLLWQGIAGGGGALDRSLGLLLATVLLVLPGRIVFVSIRRKVRTGSWIPSDAERLKNYHRKPPMNLEVFFPWAEGVQAVCWSLMAAMSIRTAIRHPFHEHSHEFAIACYLILAAVFLRNVFRRWVG